MTGLQSTPPQFRLSRLSRELYEDFLAQAKQSHSFVQMRDFLADGPPASSPYVALRHDIDFAPEYSHELAKLEHDAGVRASYFVLVDGQFYSPVETSVIRQVREIAELGHEIGLHFDARLAVGPDIGEDVAMRIEVLSSLAGVPVVSYCQHDPVNSGVTRVTLPEGHHRCIDVADVVAEHDLLYVSDSAMMWRQHTFHTALAEGRNLCLLAHAHSWLHPQDDYIAMIRDLQAEQVNALEGRFDGFVDALEGYYTRRVRDGV